MGKVINTNNEDITNKNFTVNANFLQRHYKSGYNKALEEVVKVISLWLLLYCDEMLEEAKELIDKINELKEKKDESR
jgi:hypothetical protein